MSTKAETLPMADYSRVFIGEEKFEELWDRCDTSCERCGAEEESINHVLFECLPAIQVWALSRISTSPNVFFP